MTAAQRIAAPALFFATLIVAWEIAVHTAIDPRNTPTSVRVLA